MHVNSNDITAVQAELVEHFGNGLHDSSGFLTRVPHDCLTRRKVGRDQTSEVGVTVVGDNLAEGRARYRHQFDGCLRINVM